jgi:anti-anti-sigma regulatory factor
VRGDVDAASAGRLRNHLLTAAKEHPGSIDVDLTRARLTGASAVAALAETWRFASEHGIALRVRSMEAGLAGAFDVAPSH